MRNYKIMLYMNEKDKELAFNIIYTRECYVVAEEPNLDNEFGGVITPIYKPEYQSFIKRTLEKILGEMEK